MLKDWKLSAFNGVLVAGYLLPTWAIPAIKIVISPVHGLFYERANMAAALFVSDYLQLGAIATVRFAWMLALAKLTVVAFFALFIVAALRAAARNRGASDEALAIAVTLGSVVSFLSMIMAAKIGEVGALRLHASELLLLLSIGIVMLVETPTAEKRPVAQPHAQDAGHVAIGPHAVPQT
jgi:hypothetical protein